MKHDEQKIQEALEKCAIGFDTSEIVEEFGMEDGELKLLKRKVTKRDIPPDIKAVKMLMEGGNWEEMTDEQLAAERQRLIDILKEDSGE